jgi:hypothetical protein
MARPRRLAAAACAALALAPAARGFEDPVALLRGIYGPMLAGGAFLSYEAALSAAALADMRACLARDEFCVDEGLYTTGQDFDIEGLSARRLAEDADTAVFEVAFTNLGAPVTMTYSLVREAGGWRVDDIAVAGRTQSMRDGFAAR